MQGLRKLVSFHVIHAGTLKGTHYCFLDLALFIAPDKAFFSTVNY